MPLLTFETRLPLPETTKDLQDRLRDLYAIKDELDREIELLTGKRLDFEPGTPWHCLRCDHYWLSRLPHRPRMCPACKTKKFDTRPTFTYAERARKRAEMASGQPVQVAPLPHSVVTRTVESLPLSLTPPPVLSLRERLAQVQAAKAPVSDDQLVEAINGDDAS